MREPKSVARNVGDLERVLSVVGGGALALAALKRRGVTGTALALLGAELVRRGATGRCLLYEALGISTSPGNAAAEDRAPHDLASPAATVDAREAVKVEQTIMIRASSDELYAFWRDFRNHPRFVRYLESVEIIDQQHSRWTMILPGNRRIEWTSEVINDIPPELIAWKTIGDSKVAHAGSVHFATSEAGETRVRLVMDYEPPGGWPGYVLSRLLGVSADQMVREDLRRLKALIEIGDIVTVARYISTV